MEIEGEDGSKIVLKNGSKAVFGRGSGFNTNDRTVSRRHVLFELKTSGDKNDTRTDRRVSFEVHGKNPIWVQHKKTGEIRAYKKFGNGEVAVGDWFCVSSQTPVWFTLKKKELEGRENDSDEGLQSGVVEFESIDVSEIDPVEEFGFLVIGHEFDHYTKQMIHDMKDWDWFLEELRKDSEDDEVFEKKGVRRKRKKVGSNDDVDDDWTGESEDDKEVVAKLRKVGGPKYATRSKDHGKPFKDKKSNKNSVRKTTSSNAEDEDEETLGGFIVNDDDVEQEEESDEDEEEEEFIEDNDDKEMDD